MYTGVDRTGFRWLLACAALAAGEFAASRVPQAADAWPAVAALVPLVALFGFGAGARGWHLACVLLAGAALYLQASVEPEKALRGRPWMRGRLERRYKTCEGGMAARLAPAKEALSRCAGIGIERCDAAALNRAILLGERRGLPKQARRVFAASGAMHVFAVSGVHVMAVAKVLALLAQLLFVPKRLAGAAAIPFVWGYVCVIGMHWTHKRFYTGEIIGTNYQTVFSFVSDYIYNPIQGAREKALEHPESWIFRNITSRSLTYTDKGSKNKNYTDVSIQK